MHLEIVLHFNDILILKSYLKVYLSKVSIFALFSCSMMHLCLFLKKTFLVAQVTQSILLHNNLFKKPLSILEVKDNQTLLNLATSMSYMHNI